MTTSAGWLTAPVCESCQTNQHLDYYVVDGRDTAAVLCDTCADAIMDAQDIATYQPGWIK